MLSPSPSGCRKNNRGKLFGGQAGVAGIAVSYLGARVTATTGIVRDGDAPQLGPLPPYVQLLDFLPADEHRRLLEWALDHRERFRPATINAGREGSGSEVDPAKRVALVTRKLEGLCEELENRLLGAFESIAEGSGYRGPRLTSLELEIAAHGDGAHFHDHVDIPIGPKRVPIGNHPHEDRVLSAVLYFHRQPRGFSGGTLRLYRFGVDVEAAGSDPANHVDLEPTDNSLVAFPSWVRHEVRPVRCPSGDFADYRFAVNCWYCRPLHDSAAIA
jgi:hypothetical protein